MKKTLSFILFLLIILPVFGEELQKSASSLYNNAQEKLNSIEFNIKTQTIEYNNAKQTVDQLEESLKPLQKKRATLENQLQFFNIQTSIAKTKMQNVEILINKQRLEIAKLSESLDASSIELEEKKDEWFASLKKLYLQEAQYQEDGKFDTLKILFSQSDPAHTIQNYKYEKIFESLNRDSITRLEKEYKKYEQQQLIISEKKRKLEVLKNQLEQEANNIIAQQEGQELLLSQTKGTEEVYQQLLKESRKQMDESSLAMSALQYNQSDIESKILAFETSLNIDNKALQKKLLAQTLSQSTFDLSNLIDDDFISNKPLMWPVSPERGITAYFRDADYKEYFGVNHNAVDIRAAQGSPIFSPKSGYIEKVADNGMGYSYLIVAHQGGLATLYGHISEFNVKEGELVQMGQVLAKTGGTPGTKGAGVMTTGPHLHFEVHKDGKKSNPLEYLPLEFLPEKYRK
ncbi:hypothetical protein COB57_03630 [Candidatus Peregrinibacteria bacterium]|nr:MAG: hypothetical protein COB57_03630 [Candidatus Peregrinibacteria bacterium]